MSNIINLKDAVDSSSTINRSGFVVLIGKPNVGKSTILNAIIGEKLAIVTPKPQTTRNQIVAIAQYQDSQIVMLDTPGILKKTYGSKLNKNMVKQASLAMNQADVIIAVFDGSKLMTKDDETIIEYITSQPKPIIVVLNKIDLLRNRNRILNTIASFTSFFPDSPIIPMSAMKLEMEPLLDQIVPRLPVQNALFPEDQLTTQPTNFFISEIIREKILLYTHEEIPYQCAVEIELFEESEKKVLIKSKITVYRPTQKMVLLGKGGLHMKRIATEARLDMEKFLGKKVFLEIFISVDETWLDKDAKVKELGQILQTELLI